MDVAVVALVLVLLGVAPRVQAAPIRLAATSASDLRVWDVVVDRMLDAGDLRVRASAQDTLIDSRVHDRFDQYYQGVRVFGGDIVRQTERGQTISLFGTVYTGLSLDVTPMLSREDAAAAVSRLTGVEPIGDRAPELLILPHEAGGFRLVYRATVFTEIDGIEYFLDAHTGAIVRQLSAAERQTSALGRGHGVLGDDKKISVASLSGAFVASDLLRPPALRTYDMRGNLSRVILFLNGIVSLTAANLASSTTVDWSDPVAVDAQAHAGYVYDFYYKRFGRRGLDGNNIRILNVIHPVSRNDVLSQPSDVVGLFYLNAFYAGDGVMVYGEGLPPNLVTSGNHQHWDYLAGALDVTAHELTHGVTEFTSDLIYQGESGALNEAFSDIMGTAAEFFYQTPGSGPLQADYSMGEDVITPGGIRSLSNPRAFGDPDHYSLRFLGKGDNGGVHTNSTIGSHAYYLAIEGGTNRTSGVSVSGVGQSNREQIEKVFYRAFTQLMPAAATFSVARAATIQAARDLYGSDSAAARAVTQAWTAVGVN